MDGDKLTRCVVRDRDECVRDAYNLMQKMAEVILNSRMTDTVSSDSRPWKRPHDESAAFEAANMSI